jgi:hypothetical protein
MGLLDNAFDTSRLLADRRRLLANEAAKLDSGRGAVALAASGRERMREGVSSMMGIETPEVANANKLQGILQKHSNIRTSTDAMAAANDLLNAGFSEYAQKMIENATAMRNSEAQMINANKVTGSTTDPNIAKKRQTEITASEWLGSQSMVEGYKDNLDTKKQQLLDMKKKGWVSTEAYKNLQKDIDDEEKIVAAETKSINDDVKVFGDRWNKVNIPQTEAALSRMEKLILKYTGADGSGNLPGVNVLEQFSGNFLSSEQDAEVIQALAAIENALLKERSGAAVTESEYTRFLKEVQAGFRDDAAVIRFIQEYRTALEKEKSAISGAFRPKVRNKYWKQSGWYKTYQNPEDVKDLPIGTYYFSPDDVLRQKGAKKENS